MDIELLKKAPSYLRLPLFEKLCADLNVPFYYLNYSDDMIMAEIEVSGDVTMFIKKYSEELWKTCLYNENLKSRFHMLLANAFNEGDFEGKSCPDVWSSFVYIKQGEPKRHLLNAIFEKANDFMLYFLKVWEIELMDQIHNVTCILNGLGVFDGRCYLNVRCPLVDYEELTKWDTHVYFFILMKINEIMSLCDFAPIEARIFF